MAAVHADLERAARFFHANSCAVAGLLFLRFYRASRERLFLAFAVLIAGIVDRNRRGRR